MAPLVRDSVGLPRDIAKEESPPTLLGPTPGLKKRNAALLNPINLCLMAKLARRPSSVDDLFRSTDLPIATIYRKLKVLRDLGLVEMVGRPVTRRGRRHAVYGTRVVSLNLTFDGQRIALQYQLADEPETRIASCELR